MVTTPTMTVFQSSLEPDLFVACACHGQESAVKFSAPLKDASLQRPLVSRWRGWKPLPVKRAPTEGEDGAHSLDAAAAAEQQMISRNESEV